MNTLSANENIALHNLGCEIYAGKWSNAGMVEIIKLLEPYIRMFTIPDFCEQTGMSYPGAIKKVKSRHV